MSELRAQNVASTPQATLEQLHAVGAQRSKLPGAYGGEIFPAEAYAFLRENPNGMLVDVRTQPEWQWTGQPDLAGAKGRLLSVSWKVAPQMQLNPHFETQLRAEGADETTPLFFLCRTGGRSLDAAIAMTQAGFAHCFNVIKGFEGDPDEARQRGKTNGWKGDGLPWGQP